MKENFQSSASKASETLEAPASGLDEKQMAQLELKILQRAEKKLEELLESSLLSQVDKTKEILMEIVKGVLFESGLLEKAIHRSVEKKLKEGFGDRAPAGKRVEAPGQAEDIDAIVRREVSNTLSGESLKVIIDDKFRAISLYLKSDVIPKAVLQALKTQSNNQPV